MSWSQHFVVTSRPSIDDILVKPWPCSFLLAALWDALLMSWILVKLASLARASLRLPSLAAWAWAAVPLAAAAVALVIRR